MLEDIVRDALDELAEADFNGQIPAALKEHPNQASIKDSRRPPSDYKYVDQGNFSGSLTMLLLFEPRRFGCEGGEDAKKYNFCAVECFNCCYKRNRRKELLRLGENKQSNQGGPNVYRNVILSQDVSVVLLNTVHQRSLYEYIHSSVTSV